jgi:four helix bundle protein
MGKFDITIRSFNFGVGIVQMANKLPKTPAGFAIANQLIRSGTSVGANIEEAQDAISKKEFIRIMYISLKECRESLYWLALIEKTKLLSHKEIEACLSEGIEIRSILASIIRNSKINSSL